jgi:hypothetical protein
LPTLAAAKSETGLQRKESYAIDCFRVGQLRYSLESGKLKNLTEIGTLEGFDNSYVSLMVNLTTLPDHLSLFDITVDPPALWEQQLGGWLDQQRSG